MSRPNENAMSIAFAAEMNSGMNSGDSADPTALIIAANRTSGVDEFSQYPVIARWTTGEAFGEFVVAGGSYAASPPVNS
jgi:hypothetical protein